MSKRKGPAHPPPTAEAVAAAVASLRELLERTPVLMLHDADAPSVTTVIAGAPIVGSWWSHPQGSLVFQVLQQIEDEVAWPKLVRGKVTLVHRALWPALIAVGRSEEPWQLGGLPREARELFATVKESGHARTDRLRETGDGAAIGRAVDQLERRLLVMSTQVHTTSGRHARELSTWMRWQQRVGLAGASLPSSAEARAILEQEVTVWPDGSATLPWGSRS